MKKSLLIIALLFTALSPLLSQCSMNLSLYNSIKKTPDKITDVLIQGNLDIIKQLVVSAGGRFKYSSGDIASVSLPMSKIGELVTHKGIQRIEVFTNKVRPLNDTMLKNNNVLPVHNGTAPLTQAYDGTGVIIGFIDTGIHFDHPDFKDNQGHSRVKYLWDQSLPTAGNTPVPYGYGQEFSNTDIDAGLAAASTDILWLGHGTHTTGIAAGNGLATGHYKGVAPNSDIIMVGVDFYATQNIIVDAANYIFAKATAMGKPCVINASLGDYGIGSHDGTDLQAQFINSMITSQQGRAFVAAVGNFGDVPFHLGYTSSPDTNFTLFSNNNGYIYLELYGEVANLNTTKFSIGADQVIPGHSFRGRTGFTTIASHMGAIDYDTIYNNGNRIGTMQIHSQTYNGPLGLTYYLEYYIVPDSTDYQWRLSTTSTASGKFDLWSYDVVSSGLPNAVSMPDSIYYKMPDYKQTMCSSFQCLDNVITVGNYTNRRSWTDVDNNFQVDFGYTPQAIAPASSRGPTRDGRIKPDITAPGDMVISDVVPSLVLSYYIPSGYSYLVAQDSMHVSQDGSSAASPSVAGIAALYLQKNPTATAAQVRDAINACGTRDNYTGNNLPDNTWGHGKANAFTTLTGCSTVVIDNINSNDDRSLSIYPNPSKDVNTLHINIGGYNKNEKTELQIYNVLGEVIRTIIVNDSSVELNNLVKSGVYFCNLMVNGKKVITEKIIVFN